MLQIERIKLSLEEGEEALREKAAAVLRLPSGEIQSLEILRRAVDAREEVHLVYTLRVTVKNEEKVLRRCRSKQVTRETEKPYCLPEAVRPPAEPPWKGQAQAGLNRPRVCAPHRWRARFRQTTASRGTASSQALRRSAAAPPPKSAP